MSRDLTFGIFVLLMGLGLVGNLDYADQLRIEAVKKEQHPRQAQVSPAPLYSKDCMARDRDFIAGQADGGQWGSVCTIKRIDLSQR